jgi:CHRD domain-containing protein
MRNSTRTAIAAPVIGFAALLATAGPAAAADGSVQANLSPVPVSGPQGASGQGMVEIHGTTLSFTLAAKGLLAGAPHAAHIHFGADARHECPAAGDNNAAPVQGETNPDKHFTTTEGGPAYGEIVVSLTKSGDTSPKSGLAVDRFGVGDDIKYSRGDVQVSEEVAQAILGGQAVVVVHGVDYDGDGAYSAGDRGMSDLDPSLPGEATDPAICGVLNASQMGDMPSGGVSTGGGSTTGTEHAGLIGLGALAVAGGGAGVFLARRRTSPES